MKINKTTLTKKEPLPRNFKLTFTNDKGELYLILHQNKEDIFNNLKIGADYSFSFFKGRKNYFFVNPQSIKLIMPDWDNWQDTKNFYFKQLAQELGIKTLNLDNINKKINTLKSFKDFKKQETKEHFLLIIKSAITSLYFKHRVLESPSRPSEQERKENELEKELLLEIENMLFFERWWKK